MLDSDLAKIYQIETKNLKKAVRRNMERFPSDFLFEPSESELELLRFQIGTEIFDEEEFGRVPVSCKNSASNASAEAQEKKFRFQSGTEDSVLLRNGRYAPFVFTESGVAMLSSVLHSDRAIQINISIMRLLTQLRTRMFMTRLDLVPKLDSLQQGLDALQRSLGKPTKHCDPAPEQDKVRMIQTIVAQHWGLRVEDLKSRSRIQPISLARQIAAFLMRKHLGMGFTEIGRHLGGRDHSTILHAYRKIHVEAEDNEIVRKAILFLQNELSVLQR